MPKPEIHFSPLFGMGFYIDADGTFMSMPALENGSFEYGSEIPVKEWGNTDAYNFVHINYIDHIQTLAQIMEICTLKRDYVRIGYYAERFGRVAA